MCLRLARHFLSLKDYFILTKYFPIICQSKWLFFPGMIRKQGFG